MFTGIIQSTGTVSRLESLRGDCRIIINTGKLPMDDVSLGDSIAVNGVCLTAVELGKHQFTADVSRETLSHTTLGDANSGMTVNLELALLPTTRLGGHLVSGHVDGVGTVISKQVDGRSWRFIVEAPAPLARYIAAKGSICVNGVSLTVNEIEGVRFGINIVPHTLTETTLGQTEAGHRVNLEVDVLARYTERLLLGDRAASPACGLSLERLQETGFIR